MKNTVKKYLGAALGLLVLGASVLVPVQAFAESQNRMPGSQGGLKHENLSFYGVKIKRIVRSATPTQLFTGEGFLDAICPFGGTAGKYSIALDSGEGASGLSVHSHSLALSGPAFTVVAPDTGANLPNGPDGCLRFPNPRKFTNGLVGAADDAGHSTLFEVHCSSGPNPCTP